jgi:hypothetical protein
VAGQLNGQLLHVFANRNPKVAPQSDLTLSTALAGTPVIAAMLSGLVPHDLVLRCHPCSWFHSILFTLSRYEVENELHNVEGIHNAAKMKPTAS